MTTAGIGFARPLEFLKVRQLSVEDFKEAFRAGVSDFMKKPLLSGLFGLIYAIGGLFIVYGLIIAGQPWMIIPVTIGFPLIAPFVAAGLYEMSRRYKLGQSFTSGDIFSVVLRQRGREMGWMAFVVLFIFWVWIYQIRLWVAIFFGTRPFSSVEGLVDAVLHTGNGMMFIVVGSVVGTFLATILFTFTVTAMPVLMDREIDFVSAMLLSLKTVTSNLPLILVWGAFIGTLLLIAMLPAFLGLIVVLPILGHATWHLYERTIEDTSAAAAGETA